MPGSLSELINYKTTVSLGSRVSKLQISPEETITLQYNFEHTKQQSTF